MTELYTATNYELLERIYNRIKKRKHWTKGNMALDTHGHRIPPSHILACKWCVSGAIQAEDMSWRSYDIQRLIRAQCHDESIINVNDRTFGHFRIKRAIKNAMKKCKN